MQRFALSRAALTQRARVARGWPVRDHRPHHDAPPTDPPEVAEFTLKAVAAGVLLGVVFGAANAYLGLRVGMTVSASIPAAVMTVASFRSVRARGTILEANLSQTIGSASTSLASGTIFTIPALFLWGMAPPYWQVVALCFLGGVLGLSAMIPLRRLLIVEAPRRAALPRGHGLCRGAARHGGGAAARGGSAGSSAGMAVGAAVKLLVSLLFLIPGEVQRRAAGAAQGRARPRARPGAARRRLHPGLPPVGGVHGGRGHLGAGDHAAHRAGWATP